MVCCSYKFIRNYDGATVLSVSHSAVTNTATYDAYRREMVRTDGRGNATTNAYDSIGRLAAVTDPLGATTHYAYDAVGNLIAITNALGNATIYEYDLRGNKTYEGGATYPVRYTYDDFGNKTTMTTYRNESLQSGDTTTWLYDEPIGLLTNKVYADGKGYSCSYTVDGRLQFKAEESGRWKEFLYNDWGELAKTIYSDGEIIFTLRDVQGREVLETNNIASVLNVRDEFGYVTNEIITVGLESMALTRLYDDEGRELRFASSLYVGYDASGRYSILSNNEAIVQYAYNSDGSEAGYTISLSNGMVFARNVYRDSEYPERITAISNCVNGVLVENFDYTYDLLGRPVVRNSDTFCYNPRSEVVFSRRDVANAEDGYAYDDIGNLLVSYVGANTNSYSANNLNQYTSILHASAPLSEDYLFYDLDGNLTNDSVFAYSYDVPNRLVSVLSNDVALLVNEYDSKSRRVRKITPEAAATFFYDDWNLIEERIAYTNGTISTIRYFWGKDLSGSLQGAGGVGGLLYLTVDDEIYIPCYDNNGNITQYLDANGNTVAQYTYNAFGNIISKSGPLADFFRHRFSTKFFDAETGLYYYGYRFYHPVLMRWLNRDPLGEDEGGINLYNFLYNNSLYALDLLGYRKYKKGWHGEPNINFDNDFPYNPKAEASFGDYWNWVKWKSKLNGARLIGHLEDATLLYRHYLEGSGAPMTIDYIKAYSEDSGIAVSVRNAVREAQREAERLAKFAGREFEMSSDAGNADKYPTTENWQKAIGGHSLWGEAQVYNCKDKFLMHITIHAIDRYNFNKGASDIATGAPDNENGRFEVLGWAKSFTTRGSIPITVDWKRGLIGEMEVGSNGRWSIGRSRARGR